MKEKFIVSKHGLLFIVYEQINTGFNIMLNEDSRWEDEEKANEHCRLLNEND